MVSKVLAVIGSVPPVCRKQASHKLLRRKTSTNCLICLSVDEKKDIVNYNVLTFAFEPVFLSSAYAVAICSDACGQKVLRLVQQ